MWNDIEIAMQMQLVSHLLDYTSSWWYIGEIDPTRSPTALYTCRRSYESVSTRLDFRLSGEYGSSCQAFFSRLPMKRLGEPRLLVKMHILVKFACISAELEYTPWIIYSRGPLLTFYLLRLNAIKHRRLVVPRREPFTPRPDRIARDLSDSYSLFPGILSMLCIPGPAPGFRVASSCPSHRG